MSPSPVKKRTCQRGSNNTKPTIKIIVPTESKKENEFSCNVCHRLFKIKKDMLEHICIDPDKRPYMCTQCSRRFQFKNGLKYHLSCAHGAPQNFVCEEEGCGKKFHRLIYLKQHYIAHVNYKPFRCKLCGKTFKLLQFLKRHSTVHQGKATFAPISEVNTRQGEDSDCDSEDDLPERLIRVFTCHVCNKHFTRGYNLKQHLERHKNRSFPCEVCDPEIKFKSTAERKEHYDSVHSGKPFSCQVCGYKSMMKCNLTKHLKHVHCKK